MPTYLLLRHAHAGDRSEWSGDDIKRPLSERGFRQAEKMAKTLKDYDIVEVRSSPALRCRQTAQPVAERMGLKLVVDDGLFEGNELVLPKGKGVYLLCAHGDNIPATLDRLGIRWENCAKGSCWRIKLNDKGEVKETAYIPPQA